MTSRLAVLSIVCTIAACTTPTSVVDTSETTPASEVLSAELTTPHPDSGRVLIKRDRGHVGSLCTIRAIVDRTPLAHLRQGQAVTAYLAPGEHILRAESTGICGGGDAEASVVLQRGEVKTYRIGTDSGAAIRIGPTAY